MTPLQTPVVTDLNFVSHPWGLSTRAGYRPYSLLPRALSGADGVGSTGGLGFVPVTAGDPRPVSVDQVYVEDDEGYRRVKGPYRVTVNDFKERTPAPIGPRQWFNGPAGPHPLPVFAVARQIPRPVKVPNWPMARSYGKRGEQQLVAGHFAGNIKNRWASRRYVQATGKRFTPDALRWPSDIGPNVAVWPKGMRQTPKVYPNAFSGLSGMTPGEQKIATYAGLAIGVVGLALAVSGRLGKKHA